MAYKFYSTVDSYFTGEDSKVVYIETTDYVDIAQMIDQNDGMLSNVICHTVDAEGDLKEVRLLTDVEINAMLSEHEATSEPDKDGARSDFEYDKTQGE